MERKSEKIIKIRMLIIITIMIITIGTTLYLYLTKPYIIYETIDQIYLFFNAGPGVTFKSTIEEIREYNGNTSLLVKGLEENDINNKGEFTFSIKKTTKILQGGKKINISDLKVGQTIAVTHNGGILECYPADLTNVIKIELLNEEKNNISEKENYFENVVHTGGTEIPKSIYDDLNIDYDALVAKRSIDNVNIQVKEGTLTKTGATFIITDKNEISYEYGGEYKIEKNKDGKWKEINKKLFANSFDLTYFVIRNVKAEHKIDWIEKYGELKNGEYRLGIKAGEDYVYAEFTIE